MIASPLEPELAERVRRLAVVDELLFEPGLLPVPRYPSDHAGVPFERAAAGERRWEAMLARAHVLFGYPGETSAGLADALRRGPEVGFVQGTSAGMGAHVRRAALGAEILARVRFASAAGVHAAMLAEFVFYGLLALRKDAARLEWVRRERRWEHFVMGELDGSRLAIVGMGHIGRALALRARAFGMHVVAITRTGEAQPLADETYPMSALARELPMCDAVVLTLPLTDRTAQVVDAAAIEALPPHAIFANVGRGPVADGSALLRALAEGRIRGAVLDVFDPEPLPPDHPLWSMENVILSPHTAALSIHENARIVSLFCDNLERFANGEPLRNAVNLVEFY